MKGARTAPRERKGHAVRSIIFLLLASIIISLIPLWFATVEKRAELFASYFQNPYILALNMLPVLVLTFLLYALSNRAWFAGLVSGLLFTLIAFVNNYKLTFRGEPLNFEDITLFREAGAMTGKGYTLFLDRDMILALVIVLVLVLLLKLFAGDKLKNRPGLLGLPHCSAVRGFYLSFAEMTASTRKRQGISPTPTSGQKTRVTTQKGWCTPFSIPPRPFLFPSQRDTASNMQKSF